MTDPGDLIDVLSRRHELLQSLLDTPKERRELVDKLDDSKSTVYKGVSQLQEHGLLVSTSEGLKPTLYGILALERYEELGRTARIGDVVTDLPPDSIDPSALVGARAVVPDQRSVDRHLARLERILRSARSIQGFAPAVSPRTVSVYHERITQDGLEAELVLTDAIFNYLWQDHPNTLEDSVESENIELYRSTADMPFVLLITSSPSGTEVCIDLGREGLATALLINDTPESLRWAEKRFEQMKHGAEPVTYDDLP